MIATLAISVPVTPVYQFHAGRWTVILLLVFSLAGPLAYWLQPGPYGCLALALGVSAVCFWPSRYWWMSIDPHGVETEVIG